MAKAMTQQPHRRYATPMDELLDRVRRIETRFTKYLEYQGFDTQVARAAWVGDRVVIPSRAVSFQEIMAAVPPYYEGAVPIWIGNEHIITLHKPVI